MKKKNIILRNKEGILNLENTLKGKERKWTRMARGQENKKRICQLQFYKQMTMRRESATKTVQTDERQQVGSE